MSKPETLTGICDGCGAEGVELRVINAEFVKGVCMCEECCTGGGDE